VHGLVRRDQPLQLALARCLEQSVSLAVGRQFAMFHCELDYFLGGFARLQMHTMIRARLAAHTSMLNAFTSGSSTSIAINIPVAGFF
jgi:hypothetical protein